MVNNIKCQKETERHRGADRNKNKSKNTKEAGCAIKKKTDSDALAKRNAADRSEGRNTHLVFL